jgi:crotonobetainyl-CoA:carnitine CoA-transferase CaiB-like acyl-CoA transferase
VGGIDDRALTADLWREVGGDAGLASLLELVGRRAVLPSVFAVTALAGASVALATLAAAELYAARRGEAPARVHVDRSHAALAFRRELYASPVGWELPPLWDPIAGDYAARDGWIRLHTNYAHHRDAVLRVLGTGATREEVAAAVARRDAATLEQEVVDAGGCAAAMRDLEAWRAHAQGVAVAAEPLLALAEQATSAPLLPGDALPLSGVRVLDLTRVIAGPICTSFLGAYGANVLRLDPPGFAEVPALLPETTAGKRRAWLDLGAPEGRAQLAALARSAHVLIVGYRDGALAKHGFDEARLRALNPALVIAALDAYGWSGPWSGRRGFDSLVQMSTGIAARGREAHRSERPVPLPAQALDHATGYLLAAGVCRALTRLRDGRVATVRASLARTARLLVDLGDDGDPFAPMPDAAAVEPWLEEVSTAWGPLRRVRLPGSIAGIRPVHGPEPGPLGSARPGWHGV